MEAVQRSVAVPQRHASLVLPQVDLGRGGRRGRGGGGGLGVGGRGGERGGKGAKEQTGSGRLADKGFGTRRWIVSPPIVVSLKQ